MPKPPPPEEIAQLMQFLAEETKNVKFPMNMMELCRRFKEKSGSLLALSGLRTRIEKHHERIHKMDNFDMDTKVKMIFALGASIDKEFLNELKKQAEIEVDERGRITKYKANDGSLKLEGNHGQSSIQRSMHSDRWQKVCQKAEDNESEEEGDDDSNGKRDYEKKRIDLVRFLIKRTNQASSPLSVKQLAKDYKKEFKISESLKSTLTRITSFRKRIHGMNQIDMPTKVRMLFALSAPINADFGKKLQKNAVVELDANLRIKKYNANDGSLELEGDHSQSAKCKAGWAEMKKRRVVKDSSDSEGGEEEKDSCETVGSDEEKGGDTSDPVRSNQASTSLPKRRSQRIRKSTVSTKNNNKKKSTTTQNRSGMFRGKKRARISYSSSEASEDDEESMTLGDDPSINSKANNIDNGEDNFDYDAPINNHYDKNLEHNVNDPNSERNIETPEVGDGVEEEGKKQEESSASTSAKMELMSLLELLNHLRSPIAKYTPNLIAKIDENIEKLKEKDKQIPFNIIIESLDMCIQILNTPDKVSSDEETIPISDFFYRLGMALLNIPHSSMDDFHVKMRKLATTGDEKVSMEHIRYAMQKTLDKVLH